MKKLFTVVFLLLLVAAGAAAAWMYAGVRRPYRGYADPEQFVDIRPGTGTRAIGDRLVEAGVVRDQLTFRAALWMSGQATRLKAGEYRFTDPETPAEVIGKLARGEVFVIPLTIPEGLTIKEMSKIVELKGLGPAANFVEAARDASLVRALDPAARDLEGYLLALSVCGVWGLLLALRQNLPGARLFLLLLLSYPTIYYITFPHARYRHPIEPELLILIVFFISQVIKEVHTSRTS